MIKADVWLSAFFGREIRQVKVAADDLTQMEQLQMQGWVFIEGEILFELPLVKNQKNVTACYPATEQDLNELKPLFGSAFLHSRFRPPYFSSEENRHFYQTWAENAVKGTFDHLCLIKRSDEGELQGAITIRLEQNHQAKIGLLAVAPAFQQQGIGSLLVRAAADWAQERNIHMLHIATQTSNLKAIRLYERLGATVKSVHYWFYSR